MFLSLCSLLCSSFPCFCDITSLAGHNFSGAGAGTEPAEWASGLNTAQKSIFGLDKDTVLPEGHFCRPLVICSHPSKMPEWATCPSRLTSQRSFAGIRSQSDHNVMVSNISGLSRIHSWAWGSCPMGIQSQRECLLFGNKETILLNK